MVASYGSRDTEDHFSALLSSLQHFQDSGSYTNLTLQAEDGGVRCHKAVLAPFSPLLWDLCHVEEETVIILPGVRLQVVQHLVSQFYTGCVIHSEHTVALARLLKLDVRLQGEGKLKTEDIGKKENQVSWTEDFVSFIGDQTDPVKPLLKEDIETVSSAAKIKSAAMFFNCQLCDRSERYVSELRAHYCRSHLYGDLRAEYANQTDGTTCKMCGNRFSNKFNLYCHIGVKHNKINQIMVNRGLQPLPLRIKTETRSRQNDSNKTSSMVLLQVQNEIVMEAENHEEKQVDKSLTFQNMITNMEKMVKKKKGRKVVGNDMVKKRSRQKHQNGKMIKHRKGCVEVGYIVDNMLMEKNNFEQVTGLSQELLEAKLEPKPIVSNNRENKNVIFTNLETLKCKGEEVLYQPEINCQLAHDRVTSDTKEEVELTFTVSQIQVKEAKKLGDKTEEGGRRGETAPSVGGEEKRGLGVVRVENVPGGEEISSLGFNKTSQVKLQRPRKLLDGTPILDVKFLKQKGSRPTYDDDIQEVQPVVKQEPVSARPAVKPQHPNSKEVQGGQELARMEEGGNYMEENEDEENYAMVETGGKLSGYMTSVGLGHTCSHCARSFSEAKNCKRHIREKHLGLGRRFCPRCNKDVSKRYIKEHMVICKLATSH